LNEVRRLLRRQKDNGAWPYRGARRTYLRSADNYDQLETYRTVGELVEKFGMTRDHSAVRIAADYLFSNQTDEGDFRGIYGTQYSPNYSAAIMELLIKAGYARDDRIAQGFHWLLHIRQRDGGWAIPLRTVGAKLDSLMMKDDPA
jgi:squalene cyclase